MIGALASHWASTSPASRPARCNRLSAPLECGSLARVPEDQGAGEREGERARVKRARGRGGAEESRQVLWRARGRCHVK